MEMEMEGRMENLPAVLAFIDQAAGAAGAEEEAAFAVRLAVEEVFINIVRHGYEDRGGPVSLAVFAEGSDLVITIRDEAPLFDPALAPLPDLESGWEDRPLGGLGWHLVRQLVDEIRHAPGPTGGNVVTLVKRLPAGSPDAGA
jgi:serine/threonine-protein kinase RsbW